MSAPYPPQGDGPGYTYGNGSGGWGYYAPPSPPPPPDHQRGKKNRRGIVIAIVAGVVLMLAGVGAAVALLVSDPEPDSAESVPAASAEPVETMTLAEQDAAFYRWISRQTWSVNGERQEEWVELANAMCGAFDRGASYDDVATILVQDFYDFTTGDAREFVREAVTIYCPEYLGNVQ